MKRWKVEQKHTVIVRAFVEAETEVQARIKFDDADSGSVEIRWDDPEETTYEESDWDTLKECDAYGDEL